jgi:choline kinase
MKLILIGAGRGSRLRPYTDNCHKCLVPVAGRPIVDWALHAFREVGVTDVIFVGGYRIDEIRQHHPEFTFIDNTDWENNNILSSLFYAEGEMDGPFMCAYADTIIVPALLEPLMSHPGDIVVSVDTAWNERHGSRPNPYDSHVEAVSVEGDRVTRFERIIPPGAALGEFTGVTRFTAKGSAAWRNAYHQAREKYAGKPFHHGKTFEKAYMVDLMLEMIDAEHIINHAAHHGGYIEIDTVEDYHLANDQWAANL